MATATDAVNAAFNKYLNRNAGTTGLDYWAPEWEKNKQAAIDSGMSTAQAEAAANASLEKNLGLSDERFDYISGEDTGAVSAFDKSSLNIPDWFKFQDDNVAVGARPEDWATDLQTSNLENYLEEANYQYGMQQGNVVGQQGSEWFGYQTTQDIQSYLAQGMSFDDAQAKAYENVERDIGLNSGAINFDKYGSIGYGNPLEIITDVTDTGQITTANKYLNLSQRAIDDSAAAGDSILNKTGSKLAYKYNFKTDDDGNIVYGDDDQPEIDWGSPMTDADGNQISATPNEWKMIKDPNAPGGYKITKVPFVTSRDADGNVINQTTASQDQIEARYGEDGMNMMIGGGRKTFLYNTDPENSLFDNLENVNPSDFITDENGNKLTLAQWAETEIGKASIAANDFTPKNLNMKDTSGDGMLNYQESNFDHINNDSNIQLDIGGKLDIPLGDGWGIRYKGPDKPTNWVPPIKEEEGMGGYGSGGPTYINLDMNQKSTTAADQAGKQDEKGMASGANRKKYQNPVKTSGNVPQLGITTNKRQSLIPAG